MSTLKVSSLLHATNTGTIIIPAGNRLRGVDAGSIYAPGMIIQTIYSRTDAKSTYSAPVGSNTSVTELQITITPKFANSVIMLTYNVTYEMHWDTIFRLSRNGTVIGTNTTDSGRWSGWAIPGYDTDTASTPTTKHFIYRDSPATTGALTYNFLVSSSGPTAYTFFLNRSVNSAGSDNHEVGISQVLAQEIAQ